MATYAYTFTSGDTVTPTKLNNARTISDIVNADISSTAAIAASKLEDGGITNAKISASAAIAHTKLANITAGQVLLGNASNVPTATALTGDVTVTSSGVTAIGSSKVVTAMVNNAAITAAKLSGAQSGTAPIYGARAWALVNHGSNTITASGNVSSLTDNAIGDVTLNFATAMSSASYSVVVTPQHASGQGNCLANFATRNAGSVQIIETSASFVTLGDNVFSVAVFQ